MTQTRREPNKERGNFILIKAEQIRQQQRVVGGWGRAQPSHQQQGLHKVQKRAKPA
jgi:hypothetical protein